ncbi:endonuclease/exonuclease/phosphatase family domain-containing protein 1-like [Coccinella septempunctata]|uniref:endonuclease/exonuclease/phosphatase family domain-containing protein 1-like n=1 Tax=Coccinella septempunctata TaxID=41139 RepID=UPI001D070CFB|nr:endonuclease/exonuclease/phosphatase family domain-containing protein 1-like [Coccinella septempunctata]
MGQPLSMAKKNKRKTNKLFNSLIFMNENHNLSHTFAIFDDESTVELVNVNTANENELLKVQGIDLELSKNIIKHRKAIGFFQKVEDLVVVPGMGADRLDNIKHYVCVSTRNVMRNSLQSFDSLKSVDSRTTLTKTSKLVNVNEASVYELQLIHGITQEIAAAIVYYRCKKGPFKRLEDLTKIKCIDCIRLDNISQYLTVYNEQEMSDTESEKQPYNLTLNGGSRTSNTLNFSCRNGTTNVLLDSTVADIFELLSTYSPRPIVKELFRYSRNDRPAFRVSSWDLDQFSVEKASNLGVKEVICRTILENGWSILAIQDIQDKDALRVICDELNDPQLQRVQEWKNNVYCWNHIIMDNEHGKLGFIFQSKGVEEITVISSEKGPLDPSACDSLITNFKIGNTVVQILNLKVRVDLGVDKLQDHLQKMINTETHCLICLDFGSLLIHNDFFTNLENSKLLLPTNLSNSFHSITNSSKHCSSNFVVNSRLEKYLTGLQGIQRNGLTHLAIPSGWTWGGSVSSCCPVWVEFFVTPS